MNNIQRGIMDQHRKISPIRCPRCREWVLKTKDGHGYVVRNSAMIVDGHTAVAICRKCKERVPIPIKLVA